MGGFFYDFGANTMLRAGNEIHLLMKDTNKKLKVSQGLPDWKAYLDFVNDIIVGGLKKIVVKSCAALEQQLDPVHLAKPTALGPMLEIELDLIDGAVKFIPEVGPGPGELRTIFRDWCMNFDDVLSQRGSFNDLPYAIDARRLLERRSWVVFYSNLGRFGPRRGRRGVSERTRSRRWRRRDAAPPRRRRRARERAHASREGVDGVFMRPH